MIAILIVALMISGANAGSTHECYNLAPNSVCSFMDYQHVQIPAGYNCTSAYEAAVLPAADQILAAFYDKPLCQKSVAVYLCTLLYQPCNSSLPKCRSSCDNLIQNCGSSITSILTPPLLSPDLLLVHNNDHNCSTFSSGNEAVNCVTSKLSVNVNSQVLISTPSCVSYPSNGICNQLVDYPVYIPKGSTIDILELLYAHKVQFTLSFAYMDQPCLSYLYRWICGSLFKRCNRDILRFHNNTTTTNNNNDNAITLSTPFPSFQCSSECIDYREKCSNWLIGMKPYLSTSEVLSNFLIPQCDSTSSVRSSTSTCQSNSPPADLLISSYPYNSSIYSISSSLPNVSIPCMNYNSSKFNSNYRYDYKNASSVALGGIPIYCPYPLVYADNPASKGIGVGGGACAISCTLFEFTHDERVVADSLLRSLGIMSLVSSSFLLATWLVFPKKRSQTYVICFFLCIWCVSWIFVIGQARVQDLNKVGCKYNDTLYVQPDGGWCPVQGALATFFGLSGLGWFSVIAFDLFFKVVLSHSPSSSKQEYAYHIYAWGLPTVLVIIGVANNAFGGLANLPYCFFADDLSSAPYWAEWALFYYPVLIISGLVFVSLMCVLFTLWKVAHSISHSVHSKQSTWLRHLRPVLFTLQFLIIFCFIVGYRINNYFMQDGMSDSANEFVSCLIQNGQDAAAMCGDHPQLRPNRGTWYLILIAVAGQGVFNFLAYGTQSENFSLWWRLCRTGEISENRASRGATTGVGGTPGQTKGSSKDTNVGLVTLNSPLGNSNLTSSSASVFSGRGTAHSRTKKSRDNDMERALTGSAAFASDQEQAAHVSVVVPSSLSSEQEDVIGSRTVGSPLTKSIAKNSI